MTGLAIVVLVAWLAGIAACVGGLLAALEPSADTEGKQEFVRGVVAFGGGILLAAVAFSLAPEAIAYLGTPALAVTFALGGAAFLLLDEYLARRVGNRAQLVAMLTDFVPEAIALGALIGHAREAGLLLALFIGAQNLPEGFNTFRESTGNGSRTRETLGILALVSLLGPVAAAAGYLFLQGQPVVTGAIMSFAAGGILYLVFQDIAPQASDHRHWVPPLGAVFGFALGMIGKQVLG